MTVLICYDSTNPEDIPAGAEAVLGYSDGHFAWTQAQLDRYPRAFTLSCLGDPNAQGWDVETGNAPISEVAPHAKAKAESTWCVIYCNVASVTEVSAAVGGFANPVNFPAPGIYWWAADWTGEQHDHPGAIATQYADPTTSGGHFDISSIAVENFPPLTNSAPQPQPEPAPQPQPEPAPQPQPIPAPTIPSAVPMLGRGSVGVAVRELQECLNHTGAHLAVDGNFGQYTLSALINFQRWAKIPADGYYGPQTRQAFEKYNL